MSVPGRLCSLLILSIALWSCEPEETPEFNESPSCPIPSSPENYSQSNSKTVLFAWNPATDPEGEKVTYHLQVSSDAGFTDIIFSDALSTLAHEIVLPEEGFYFWRVRAKDASNNTTIFSKRQNFLVAGPETTNYPPFPPELRYPELDEAINANEVKLGWSGHDLDNSHLSYDLYIGTDYGYQSHVAGHISGEEFTLVLDPSKVYYWKIKATDAEGNVSVSPVWWFKSL